LLADALNETVVVTIDGRRRTISKREAIVTQMVDKSASADLRATKMLIDVMKGIEHKAGEAAPPREPCRLGAAAVVQHLVARLRRQILQENRRREGGGGARIIVRSSSTENWWAITRAKHGRPLTDTHNHRCCRLNCSLS
jgi:hypothetical protein